MSAKQRRQDELKKIIVDKEYKNVTSLLHVLNRRLNKLGLTEVTQPTLSRDLQELKVTGGRGEAFALPDKTEQRLKRQRLRQEFEIAEAKLLPKLSPIVVRTKRGYARFLGVKIEELYPKLVQATVCSDDVAVLYVELQKRKYVTGLLSQVLQDIESQTPSVPDKEQTLEDAEQKKE